MDFSDDWVTRAWRHEAGNQAQKVYAVEEFLEGEYETELPDFGSDEEMGVEDLEQLVEGLDERMPTYSEGNTMGLDARSNALHLKETTEAVLALDNGREHIPVNEITCILRNFDIEPETSEAEVYGNEAWRLPIHTIAKNSNDHGGPALFMNEYSAGDNYVIEMFDNGEGTNGVDLDEIWEKGETGEYGNSGFGLNMAYHIVDQLGGEIAAYTREDELEVSSPVAEDYELPEMLEGVNYDDLGMGFVVEMPLYQDS